VCPVNVTTNGSARGLLFLIPGSLLDELHKVCLFEVSHVTFQVWTVMTLLMYEDNLRHVFPMILNCSNYDNF
jgi:hypothetical protein